MSLPLISVVVPSFNHQRFIVEALTSVVGQDYPELELVIVDDGSTDATPALLEPVLSSGLFRNRFRNIKKVFRGRNEGAHSALNEGVRLAEGKYVSLLNSDDLYAPGRVSAAVGELERTKSRLAFSAVEAVDEDSSPTFRSKLARQFFSWPEWVCLNLPTWGFGFLRCQLAASTGNLVFERSLHSEVDGFANLRYCHDWDFILACVLQTEPVFIPECAYRYRFHGQNSFSGLSHLSDLESAAVIRRFFLRSLGSVANPLAPTQRNWPGMFEHIIELFGLTEHWEKVTEQRPRYARSQLDGNSSQ